MVDMFHPRIKEITPNKFILILSNPTIQGDMSHARKTGAGTSSPHCDDCNNKEMKLHQRTCQVGVLQSGCLQVPLAQNSLTKIKESSNNMPMTQLALHILPSISHALNIYCFDWSWQIESALCKEKRKKLRSLSSFLQGNVNKLSRA